MRGIAQGRNPKGRKLAKQRFEDHIEPVLGSVDLASINAGHLRLLRASLEDSDKDLSPASVRHMLGDFRGLLNYAREIGVITTSPWVKSLMPKLPEQAPRPLTDKEIDAVLKATPEKYQLAVKLGLLTGIRWSEPHRLEWSDVKDLPQPHLLLRQTKSGRFRRVPLCAEAVELMQNERQRSQSRFVNPWRSAHAGSVVKRIRRLSKVEGFGFHRLRHTFACRWLDRGGSKESLQRILGHVSISTTEIYGRMSDGSVFAEANRLDSQKVGQKLAKTGGRSAKLFCPK